MEEKDNISPEIVDEPDFSTPEPEEDLESSEESFDAKISALADDESSEISSVEELNADSSAEEPSDSKELSSAVDDEPNLGTEPEESKVSKIDIEEVKETMDGDLVDEEEPEEKEPKVSKIDVEEIESDDDSEETPSEPEEKESKVSKIDVEEIEPEEEPTPSEKLDAYIEEKSDKTSSRSHSEDSIRPAKKIKSHTGLIVLLAIILIIGLTVAGVAIVCILMRNGVIG